jgi:hypothetical protein
LEQWKARKRWFDLCNQWAQEEDSTVLPQFECIKTAQYIVVITQAFHYTFPAMIETEIGDSFEMNLSENETCRCRPICPPLPTEVNVWQLLLDVTRTGRQAVLSGITRGRFEVISILRENRSRPSFAALAIHTTPLPHDPNPLQLIQKGIVNEVIVPFMTRNAEPDLEFAWSMLRKVYSGRLCDTLQMLANYRDPIVALIAAFDEAEFAMSQWDPAFDLTEAAYRTANEIRRTWWYPEESHQIYKQAVRLFSPDAHPRLFPSQRDIEIPDNEALKQANLLPTPGRILKSNPRHPHRSKGSMEFFPPLIVQAIEKNTTLREINRLQAADWHMV